MEGWSPLPLAGEGGPAEPGRVRGAARVISRGLRRGSPHPTSADAEATFSRAREKGGHSWRWMLAENVGTVTRTWLYPGQMAHWSPVGPEPPDDAPIRASPSRHEARLGKRETTVAPSPSGEGRVGCSTPKIVAHPTRLPAASSLPFRGGWRSVLTKYLK